MQVMINTSSPLFPSAAMPQTGTLLDEMGGAFMVISIQNRPLSTSDHALAAPNRNRGSATSQA